MQLDVDTADLRQGRVGPRVDDDGAATTTPAGIDGDGG
jgi:hypothetical protein